MKSKIKKFLKNMCSHIIFRRLSTIHFLDNNLLPSLIISTPPKRLREIFNLPKFKYESQINQDFFALIINRFKPGYFIEIGANDGKTLSNTYYLEEKFGWNGILVEANPIYENHLNLRRNSVVINKAISKNNGPIDFVSAGLYGGIELNHDRTHSEQLKKAKIIQVESITLERLLKENDSPDRVNFISIDVEGGEVDIVEQMVSQPIRFTCGCIEHNFRINDLKIIEALLASSNYKILWSGQTKQDLFFIDNLVDWD